MPNLDFPLEGVLWLVGLSAGSGDLVVPLVLVCGFLPPMIPSLEVAFLWVACLVWAVLCPDSDSISDPVAEPVGLDESFLEAFVGRSGEYETDFGFETGTGLLLIIPSAPSLGGRCTEVVSRLRKGAGDELDELERRDGLSLLLPISEESEPSS